MYKDKTTVVLLLAVPILTMLLAFCTYYDRVYISSGFNILLVSWDYFVSFPELQFMEIVACIACIIKAEQTQEILIPVAAMLGTMGCTTYMITCGLASV